MRLVRFLVLGLIAAFAVVVGVLVTASLFLIGLIARLGSKRPPAAAPRPSPASGDVIEVEVTSVPSDTQRLR